MRAQAGKAKYAAVSVLDREHHPRPEIGVGSASHGARREAGGHELLGGVAESTEVVHELIGTDRRVADTEVAEDLLIEIPLGQCGAGGPAAP
jgi:hypothetical protein